MNHLVIFAHPYHQSFNRAILDQVIEATKQANAELQLRDLYSLNFNPILSQQELQAVNQGIVPEEIQYEHQLIARADLITLVYPLWWMGFPAILKGYLDRVLTLGFAYQNTENGSVGLLQGKKMQHFITLGNNVEKYEQLGFSQAIQHCLVDGLFNFCGITDIQHQLFGDIYVLDDQARQQVLAQVKEKTSQNLTALLAEKA